MKLKPYPAYKNSGVDWLGNLPKEWKVNPLKHHFKIVGGSTPKSDQEEYWDGDITWVTPSDLSKLSSFSINNSQRKITSAGLSSCGSTLVPAGSIVLSTRAPIGSIAFADEELCTNQGCKSLVPDTETNSMFYTYLLSVNSVELNARGKGTTFLELSGDELNAFKVGFPSLKEQSSIVSFLDRETLKLDTLIAKQQHLIELLQEKRQAIISHAVTKGLNPDAKMKDSGVEWLGMVPESWTVLQFRHMVSIQNGSDYKHIESDDGPYPVIGSGGEFRRATDYIYDGISVLLGRKGTIDKPLYIEGKFWVVDTMFYTIIKDIVLPKYVFNCAKIIPFDLLSTSTALPSMTQNDLKTLYFAMPNSLSEQESIISYIDVQTTKIDTLIDKAKRSIELAKEHRTALISAAVTGKIDVRNTSDNLELA